MKTKLLLFAFLVLLLAAVGCRDADNTVDTATPAADATRSPALATVGVQPPTPTARVEQTPVPTESSAELPTPEGSDEPTPVPTEDSVEPPTPTGSDAQAPPAVDNAAQIYAAAIRQIYAVDHSFDRPPGWPLVYVVSVTDDSTMLDAPMAPPAALSPELQEAITAELADQPYGLIWIESPDEAPIDQTNGQIAGGDGIVIKLGNIHAQEDGSVQLPFFMTCGGLCGIGKTYVLDQVGDIWQVTGSVGPLIMS